MNDLAEFFIKKTHKRIKNKIQSSNYTYSQISPYDESIVSKVINFKLTKNNKYLVTNKFIKNLVECNLFNINDNLNMYINDHLRMYTSDYALI